MDKTTIVLEELKTALLKAEKLILEVRLKEIEKELYGNIESKISS